MDAALLVKEIEAAGCTQTSAGVIAVDTKRLISRFLEKLQVIEYLEAELQIARSDISRLKDEAAWFKAAAGQGQDEHA